MAIAKTTEADIGGWVAKKTKDGRKVKGKWIYWRELYLGFVTTSDDLFNTVIILANAILAVLLTLNIARATNQNDLTYVDFRLPPFGWPHFFMKSIDAFTTVGGTLVLFFAAELVPKQISQKFSVTALLLMFPWLVFLAPLIPVALGVIAPIRAIAYLVKFARRRAS